LDIFVSSLGAALSDPYVWIACLVSAAMCGGLIVFKDLYMTGPARAHVRAVQSAHVVPTPRLGGVAVMIGLCTGFFFVPDAGQKIYGLLLLSALPVFVAGLLEDTGRDIAPRRRLLAAAVSSIFAILLLGVWLPRIGIPGADAVMGITAVAMLFTVFATTGICNAFNLIDGLNGLSAGTGIVTALALGAIAIFAGQAEIASTTFLLVAVLAGFLLFNYPFGKIFMGDAGAYSLGHMLAWVSVYLMATTPSLSPWAIVLVLFWPVADTFFAIYRRRRSGRATDQPDRLHYHQLVMRALEIFWFGRRKRYLTNPLATLILMPFIVAPAAAGVLLWDNGPMACVVTLGFAGLFVASYLLGMRLASRRAFQPPARVTELRREMAITDSGEVTETTSDGGGPREVA
jgi:UDP-N-acetylmuramyl pentapeptide phosphotransferase/UDP-N-acetylglucosamine-1-phosphate transferase